MSQVFERELCERGRAEGVVALVFWRFSGMGLVEERCRLPCVFSCLWASSSSWRSSW